MCEGVIQFLENPYIYNYWKSIDDTFTELQKYYNVDAEYYDMLIDMTIDDYKLMILLFCIVSRH